MEAVEGDPRHMAMWAGLTRTVAGFEEGGMGPPGKKCWQPLEARKTRKQTLTRVYGGIVAQLTP